MHHMTLEYVGHPRPAGPKTKAWQKVRIWFNGSCVGKLALHPADASRFASLLAIGASAMNIEFTVKRPKDDASRPSTEGV